MKQIQLILGNITFENGNAIVHKVEGILHFDTIEQAEQVGDDLVNLFDGYVIPEAFKGGIFHQCKTTLTLH